MHLEGARLDGDQDQIVVPVGDASARVSTDTLLTACRNGPERRRGEIVEEWLGDIRRQLAEASSLGQVEPARLRLQAVPRSDQPPAGLSSSFNAAFDLLVVEDRDGFARRVQQADLDAVGLSANEAVSAALNATIATVLTRLDVRDHQLPGGTTVRLASADGVPYVSAGITSIRQLAGTDSPYGSLVGVPQHSALVILPVSTSKSLGVLPVLAGLVGSMYDGGTDPCSRGVYWFVGDEAYPLGVDTDTDGRQTIVIPPEVADIAASLPT